MNSSPKPFSRSQPYISLTALEHGFFRQGGPRTFRSRSTYGMTVTQKILGLGPGEWGDMERKQMFKVICDTRICKYKTRIASQSIIQCLFSRRRWTCNTHTFKITCVENIVLKIFSCKRNILLDTFVYNLL